MLLATKKKNKAISITKLHLKRLEKWKCKNNHLPKGKRYIPHLENLINRSDTECGN